MRGRESPSNTRDWQPARCCAAATENGNATSGYINPGFNNKVQALQLNPFVKFRGAEVFAVIEQSKGRAATGAARRR